MRSRGMGHWTWRAAALPRCIYSPHGPKPEIVQGLGHLSIDSAP
jgi:hypothetical protein